MKIIAISCSVSIDVHGIAFAQSESGGAALEGSVSDPAGTLIPSAQITIRETQTGLERKITANAEGAISRQCAPGWRLHPRSHCVRALGPCA